MEEEQPIFKGQSKANQSSMEMEWQTIVDKNYDYFIHHSTPNSYRPAPTASPNLSRIVNLHYEISKLVKRLAAINLNE